MEFDWKNPDEVAAEVERRLRARGAALRRIPERAVRRATFELLALVQRLVPKATSTLVRSITAKVERPAPGLVEGRVGTWLEYAPWVEEGTGIYGPRREPILILPKRKRALFWGAVDASGKPVIRKKALVRGMRPRRPFGRALRQFVPRYVRIIEQEIEREAAR